MTTDDDLAMAREIALPPPDIAAQIAWLEANAARCKIVHPDADCHKMYRRNAAALRATAIRTRA